MLHCAVLKAAYANATQRIKGSPGLFELILPDPA
jgi:hypothetical protein